MFQWMGERVARILGRFGRTPRVFREAREIGLTPLCDPETSNQHAAVRSFLDPDTGTRVDLSADPEANRESRR